MHGGQCARKAFSSGAARVACQAMGFASAVDNEKAAGWQPSRPTFPAQGFGQAEHLGSRAFTELRSSLQDKGFLGPHSLNTQQKRHAPERSTDSGCSRNCSEFLGGGWGGQEILNPRDVKRKRQTRRNNTPGDSTLDPSTTQSQHRGRQLG